ncbi:MAG: hypothetical protein F9K23_12890 [Bacteroidetes bacterium]|nr:MAG: hypothetical protein F9K23_12890 [Bacteroidota bacterium]
MKKAVLFFCFLVSLSLSAQVKHKCLYAVNEKAAIYEKQALGTPVLKLRVGDLVRVVENTGKSGKTVLEGKKIMFEWLKVSFKDNPADLEEEELIGYTPSIYLKPYLDKLPISLIKDYDFLSLENGDRIDKNQIVYNFYYNQGYDVPVDSANCGCYVYYEHMLGVMYTHNDGSIEKDINHNDRRLDTLKYFISIEAVDSGIIKNEVKSPYQISNLTDSIRTIIRWEEHQDDIETKLVGKFYIYLNNGKDSVLINAEKHEYGSSERFVGEITRYNKYLLCWESFFYNGYFLIDKTTGAKTEFTAGEPIISPNGKFVIDFYEEVDYEAERTYGTMLTLSSIGDSLRLTRHITVGFRSFVPIEDAFWISDTELVMTILPLDNEIFRMCGYKTEADNRQYIKLKVVYFDK